MAAKGQVPSTAKNLESNGGGGSSKLDTFGTEDDNNKIYPSDWYGSGSKIIAPD